MEGGEDEGCCKEGMVSDGNRYNEISDPSELPVWRARHKGEEVVPDVHAEAEVSLDEDHHRSDCHRCCSNCMAFGGDARMM